MVAVFMHFLMNDRYMKAEKPFLGKVLLTGFHNEVVDYSLDAFWIQSKAALILSAEGGRDIP